MTGVKEMILGTFDASGGLEIRVGIFKTSSAIFINLIKDQTDGTSHALRQSAIEECLRGAVVTL